MPPHDSLTVATRSADILLCDIGDEDRRRNCHATIGSAIENAKRQIKDGKEEELALYIGDGVYKAGMACREKYGFNTPDARECRAEFVLSTKRMLYKHPVDTSFTHSFLTFGEFVNWAVTQVNAGTSYRTFEQGRFLLE